MNQSTVVIVADNFAGPTRPHVRMVRLIGGGDPRVHHARETKHMRALARTAWGERADVVRIREGHYEAVWCAHPTEPYPELEEGYRKVRQEWKLNGDTWQDVDQPRR